MFKRRLLPIFSLDIALIAISAIWGFAYLTGRIPVWPDFWNIDRDWGAGEIYNYIKWLVLAFVFFTAFLRERVLMMLSLFVITLILLGDDSLQLHETLGPVVVESIGLQKVMGLKAYTVGPMVVWGALGLAVLALTFSGWRSASAALKRKLYPLFGYFFVIVFFAVGVDAIHELFGFPKIVKGILGIVEDGGEMVTLTAMVRYAWHSFGAKVPLPAVLQHG